MNIPVMHAMKFLPFLSLQIQMSKTLNVRNVAQGILKKCFQPLVVLPHLIQGRHQEGLFPDSVVAEGQTSAKPCV